MTLKKSEERLLAFNTPELADGVETVAHRNGESEGDDLRMFISQTPKPNAASPRYALTNLSSPRNINIAVFTPCLHTLERC